MPNVHSFWMYIRFECTFVLNVHSFWMYIRPMHNIQWSMMCRFWMYIRFDAHWAPNAHHLNLLSSSPSAFCIWIETLRVELRNLSRDEQEPSLTISKPKHHLIRHVGGILEFSWWAESRMSKLTKFSWRKQGNIFGKSLDRPHHLLSNR